MFPNLKAELTRKNIKYNTLAEILGISYDSVVNKMNGKTDFTRTEIFQIRNILFPDLSLNYLFESGNKKRDGGHNESQNGADHN